MKKKIQMALLGCAVGLAVVGAVGYQLSLSSAPDASAPAPEAKMGAAASAVPVKGTVTMLDLGATECIPCKMMAPILKELEKEYEGKAAIVFIDVWKDPDPARKYGVRAIPTQIFFNEDGKEVYRHTGFMDKKSIVNKLEQLGVASSPS
jgi:thioredoxin 1